MTEEELKRTNAINLIWVEKNLWEKKQSKEEINNQISGFFHLNDPEKLTFTWAPKNICELYEFNLEKMMKLGMEEYFEKHTHPATDRKIFDHLIGAREGRITQPFHTFQQVRTNINSNWFWVFNTATFSNRLNSFVKISHPLKGLETSLVKDVKRLSEHEFLRKNYCRFMSLTKREKEVLSLLALGILNGDIAEQLCISPNGVRKHKENIDKTLDLKHRNINKGVYYLKYAISFGLNECM